MTEQRTYPNNINIPAILQALKDHFMPQGYQTQSIGVSPHMIFQMAKTGALHSVTGTARAMTIQFDQKPDGTTVSLGEQKWMDKAAVGAVGLIIWPLFFTAAYGAWRQSGLPSEIWQVIDSNAYGSPYGPAQTQMPPYPSATPPTAQITQPYAAPSSPTSADPYQQPIQGPKYCPDCGKKNEGSKFCPNCGKQLN